VSAVLKAQRQHELQHALSPGLTLVNWISVHDQLPDIARAVMIAYRFNGDDVLTVDIGERDREGWYYVGGGPIGRLGRVMFWAYRPLAPTLAERELTRG
jgi:hypothetical protein